MAEKYKLQKTKGKISTYYTRRKKTNKVRTTMQLMGLPYQFLPSVDPRAPGISDEIGRSYVEHIIMDAPIITVLPGKPRYLPGTKDKASVTNALISATNGNFKELQTLRTQKDEDLKLYDFQSAYIDFFQYVNMLNRSTAGFMELNDAKYKINGKNQNFLTFDWKDYRWDGTKYHSATAEATKILAKNAGKAAKSALKTIMSTGSSLLKKVSGGKIDFTDKESDKDKEELDVEENIQRTTNFVQFYVEPESGDSGMRMSNSTTQSIFKQALDQGSDMAKQIAFLANSGGVDADSFQQLGDSLLTTLDNTIGDGVSNVSEGVGSVISRLLSSGKTVIKGENIMMPDIWTGCDMGKSHTITCHYKAPYGNKLALYMDVMVPMNYWIALAYPHATTANSYSAPYLVKVYQKGGWTCNLGCITDFEIRKDVVEGSRNIDGLATEVDVTVTITELYSDLAITPANDPILFLNNSSLVEYLATSCGLNLIESQLSKKASLIWNSTINFIKDAPSTVGGKIMEEFDKQLSAFTGL